MTNSMRLFHIIYYANMLARFVKKKNNASNAFSFALLALL